MSISKRILLYSFGVVTLVAVLILAYFTLMLSPLYAKQIEEDRLTALKEVQAAQLTRNEKKVTRALNSFDTPNSIFALTLRKETGTITVNSLYKNFDLTFEDQVLKELYQEGLVIMAELEELSEKAATKKIKDFGKKVEAVAKAKELQQSWPNDLIGFDERETEFRFNDLFNTERPPKHHVTNDQQVILETTVTDKSNSYTTYMGYGEGGKEYYLVFAAAMTPKLTALNTVIITSLPTILVVLAVIILLATLLFSRVLIKPLKRVSGKMTAMKEGSYDLTSELAETKKLDEYQQLEQDLVSLYSELEQQKQTLASQNKKQKVFLAASSHQLKTPVTAGLLLVDGMIAEVGKYQNTKKYLPELKEKLVNMQQIINEILLIEQHAKEAIELKEVDLKTTIGTLISKQQFLVEERGLEVTCDIEPGQFIQTYLLYFEKIIDNLLINGINYSPTGSLIKISGNRQQLMIENTGVQIEEEYLSKLFEPFVRPAQRTNGHGLGLYVVAQYAQLLGIEITLKNNPETNSVVGTLRFG